eukprot:5389416-Pleurochrysis_carterae.AAC.1
MEPSRCAPAPKTAHTLVIHMCTIEQRMQEIVKSYVGPGRLQHPQAKWKQTHAKWNQVYLIKKYSYTKNSKS